MTAYLFLITTGFKLEVSSFNKFSGSSIIDKHIINFMINKNTFV